jgi:hypothetical protein
VLADGEVMLLPTNPALATVVEGIAALTAARGEHVRSVELLGLAHTLQGFRNSSSLDHARASAAVATTLDEAAIEAAYARGRNLGRADALALTP